MDRAGRCRPCPTEDAVGGLISARSGVPSRDESRCFGSDPKVPRVVGELKIPGFSNYMQMIDETHLLAIGRDATLEGRALGLKLSIFDVSDMTAPKETHNHVIAGDFWSSAAYDHKAFTYFAARKVLAIPASGTRQEFGTNWWDRYRSSLFIFDVDINKGISERGTVEMNEEAAHGA